ncbi:hypothetical protein LSTR_LSTR002483 [Laodelphax striatellus]|uniref:PHD-type domain-containing protein n=1 Tax=Laodelphax striatellus TaxID=195883 RepID=A0A482X3W8_LAOST|nr:hypothetical protein LSTR_LSTR002483 [Laodelphax striatellus]
MEQFQCGKCEKDVPFGDKAMFCEGLCEQWYHIDCVKMPEVRYLELQKDAENRWRCPTCDTEPFLTICRDIKYLQSVIFSISSKAPLSTLENIHSELKTFIVAITVRNENVLEDVEDEMSNNNVGETPFNDEEYQSNMNIHDTIGIICKKNKKSTHGSADKYQPAMDVERKTPSGKLLQPCSIIISETPDIFDEDEICCKQSPSSVSNNSELIMEEIEETGETLSAETSASKTDIPIADQQEAIAEENADPDHQQVGLTAESAAQVDSAVPTSKSKSAAGEPVATGGTGEYEVEDILDHMKVHDKTLFLVKWKNYGHESNSWECREDLTNCKLAISKYFRRALINYENALNNQGGGLE